MKVKDLYEVKFTLIDNGREAPFWQIETTEEDGSRSIYGMHDSVFSAFLEFLYYKKFISMPVPRLQATDQNALGEMLEACIASIGKACQHIYDEFYDRDYDRDTVEKYYGTAYIDETKLICWHCDGHHDCESNPDGKLYCYYGQCPECYCWTGCRLRGGYG